MGRIEESVKNVTRRSQCKVSLKVKTLLLILIVGFCDFREDKKPNKEELTKELGDIIAYIVLLGNCFNIDFEDILNSNIQQ